MRPSFETLTSLESHPPRPQLSLPHSWLRYTRDEDDLESLERDVSEESGWKLVHGDVFRPPKHLEVLSALIGTGAATLGTCHNAAVTCLRPSRTICNRSRVCSVKGWEARASLPMISLYVLLSNTAFRGFP